MMTHVNNIRGTRLIDVPHLPVEQAIKLLMQKSVWVREAVDWPLEDPDTSPLLT